ncbi:hypothetical protein [Aliicoccus persicus]|uniref:hypothetical protein n=1 Tax=Aliicoccus persicus TaxID=930138 RepID=UPI003612D71E
MFLINLYRDYFNYDKSVVHIRSNLYEIGQARHYPKAMKDSNLNELKLTFDQRYKKLLRPNDDIEQYHQLYNNFIQDVKYDENVYDFHLLDLYLWELRLSHWHSDILNTHDVCFQTLSPFNHRILLEISLSFNYEERRSGYMFQELINNNWPVLNFFGDNDINNMYEKKVNQSLILTFNPQIQ